MRWWTVAAGLLAAAQSAPVPSGKIERAPAAVPTCRSEPRLELNIQGYQSDFQPERHADRLNSEYVLPSDATLAYFRSRGITVFRLPIKWERTQPAVGGPLDQAKVAELLAYLDHADTQNARFIADLHSFGRRDGDHVLGSKALPIGALPSFWAQFARAFQGRFVGYDIMNEPHDMPAPDVWPKAAQATVDAIRKVDSKTPIYVEGDDWSNAERWPRSNANLVINDPARRLIYSAHQYFDKDTSGQYRRPYATDGANPTIGAQRLQPFLRWLRDHRAQGHIGEFGVPYADKAWLPVLDNFLGEVYRNCDVIRGMSYWAAGDWSGVDAQTVQPVATKAGDAPIDRPQMTVLTRRLKPAERGGGGVPTP